MNQLTNFIGLKLKNPVFVSSGIVGFGEEYSKLFDINELGGIITKTITLKPRKGNQMPRIIETDSGMINSIGLENPGVDKFIEEKIHYIRKNLKNAVVVSVGGESQSEFVEIIRKLNKYKCISAVELNLSCPNVGLSKGVELISQNPDVSYKTVKSVKKMSRFPVIAKLSPAVKDITKIAVACEQAGADALSLINTVPGSFNLSTGGRGSPKGGGEGGIIFGGLSGPGIKSVALKAVSEVSKKVKIPIMGVGGISCVQNVLEFFDAGAKVVAVGSCMFKNPMLPIEIIRGLKHV